MARFIPAVTTEDIVHDSERVVYQALCALSDEFVVLHSFPWLRPERDVAATPLREGEADFIVAHRGQGILILEVKGGVPELRQRTWFRSGKEMRDPFDQARRNRYALLDAIEERTSRRIARSMFTHGDVVVFPHCQYSGPLPLNADARILLDARAMPRLQEHLVDAFRAWERHPTRLTHAQFADLLEALMPKLRLLKCAVSELAIERQRIVQITHDQHAVLQGLVESDRVLVEGTAGSGKTLLAVDFAASLAVKGQSVIFLCFNRGLADWLNEQVQLDPRLRSAGGGLEISTFHAFALRLATRASVEFAVPGRGDQAFWDDEVPLILEQALDLLRRRGGAPLYDAVIVDEAQDFSPDWWVTVESLTKGGREGRLYAFVDLHQSLRGHATLPAVTLPTRFRLNTNCRNTKAIASTGGHLRGAEVTLLAGAPQGEPPALHRAQSPAASAGVAIAEVRRLLRSGLQPCQIALIGPASLKGGSLARFSRIDDLPLVEDASDWRRGAGVLVTTARSFKGLEADVVVAYDLSTFGPHFTLTDLYVAWTRARHRLICVANGAETRARIEAALAASQLSTVDA